MTPAQPFYVRTSANVLVQELKGESVLLNLQTERYFGLDDVGTRMWEVLSKSESLQQARDTLLDEYEVDPKQLENDLRALIEKLSENGLIEVRSE
jgi:hypothetical protein